MADEENRWTCPRCFKSYAKNYKHKAHTTRCLILRSRVDRGTALLQELRMTQDTDINKHTFRDMFDEIKQDSKHIVNQRQIEQDLQRTRIQETNNNQSDNSWKLFKVASNVTIKQSICLAKYVMDEEQK